jgi:hypothetical protein
MINCFDSVTTLFCQNTLSSRRVAISRCLVLELLTDSPQESENFFPKSFCAEIDCAHKQNVAQVYRLKIFKQQKELY